MSKVEDSEKRLKKRASGCLWKVGWNQSSAHYNPRKSHRVPLGVICYDFIKILLTYLQCHQKDCIQGFPLSWSIDSACFFELVLATLL